MIESDVMLYSCLLVIVTAIHAYSPVACLDALNAADCS